MYENNEPYNFTTDPEKNQSTETENSAETEKQEAAKENAESQDTREIDIQKAENTVYNGYSPEGETVRRNSQQYQQQNGGQWGVNGQIPYNAYGQPYGSYQYDPYPQQPPVPAKKKKSNNGGLVAGLLVAALVIGGVSGFGGSYLARRLDGESVSASGKPASTQHGNFSPDENEHNSGPVEENPSPENSEASDGLITAPDYVKPDNEIDNDLSGLSNMASINNSTEYTYKQLYDKVNESVVLITSYVDMGSGEYEKYGTGSGVIFTTDGYIVTNNHVIEDAGKISVTVDDKYSDNVEMEAVLVGTDSATDLAILKIARDEPFTAAALGDSDKLDIGQEVCAIGAPLGLKKSITNGIVSGLNRYTDSKGYVLSSIQTNAAINPGNSGGGLFDMYGNVIGIVNSKLVKVDNGATTTENLGFAITINEAKPIMSDLINYGYVKGRPMLGISAHEVTSYEAQIYGLKSTGLLVAEISETAPAANSELRIGDLITHVNGERVEVLEDVQEIIKNMKAGDTIQVTVIRTSSESSGYFTHTTSKEYTFDLVLTATE
ncbi:MAG: trypsin-like peptidase domain-containing protein [Firmicutes bacterium]|nr:trypsin-like peptidase domain-containing protein [[Eubacterium] siraeum]MCM1488045.1 trypsin-like peptidase domain-containing protein [Bacillota bacterium]